MPTKVTLQNHLKKHNIASDIDWNKFVVIRVDKNKKRIKEVYLRRNRWRSIEEHLFFSVLSQEQYDKYRKELKLLWSEMSKIHTNEDKKQLLPLFMKLNIKGINPNFNDEWNTVTVIKKNGKWALRRFGMILENEKQFVALKSLPPQFASRFDIEYRNNIDSKTVRKIDESKMKIIEKQQERFPALHALIQSQNQEEISTVLRLENVNQLQNSKDDDRVENKETEKKEQENKVPDNNELDDESKTNDYTGEQTDEERQLQDNEADETKQIDKVDESPHQVIEISIEGKNIPMYLTKTLELLDYITLKVVGRIQTESSFDTLEREGRTTIEWCDNYPKNLSFYKQYKERSYFMQ